MKTLLLYVLLAGLPLVGVVVILRVGGGLVPPRGVGGLWLLQRDSAQAAPTCVRWPSDEDGRVLEISQSGPRLVIAFGDESLRGRIRDGEIEAGSEDPARAPCPPGGRLTLSASVAEPAHPDSAARLEGTLAVQDCDCRPLVFSARPPSSHLQSGLRP